jgi:hypothetical protein
MEEGKLMKKIFYIIALVLCIFSIYYFSSNEVNGLQNGLDNAVTNISTNGNSAPLDSNSKNAQNNESDYNPPEFLDELKSLIVRNDESSINDAYNRLLMANKSERIELAKLVFDLPAGSKRNRLMQAVCTAAQNGELTGLIQLMANEWDSGLTSAFVLALERHEAPIEKLLEFVPIGEPKNEAHQAIISQFCSSFKSQNLGNAIQSAKRIRPDIAEEFMRLSVLQRSRTDPQEVIAAFNSGILPKQFDFDPIVSGWGAEHPDKTSGWVLHYAETQQKPEIVGSFVGGWLLNDSKTASQWVKDLPAGPQKIAAITAIIGYLKYHNATDEAKAWESEL